MPLHGRLRHRRAESDRDAREGYPDAQPRVSSRVYGCLEDASDKGCDSQESAGGSFLRSDLVARVEDTIYVLDCFEKDTAKTERKDLNTARSRLAAVKQRILEERRNEKRKSKQ